MRILHVTPFYPPSIGGISNVVFNLCNELRKYDHEIRIITAKNLFDRQTYRERKFEEVTEIKSVYCLGWPYSTLRNLSFPADMGFKLNLIIKDGIFDVIHVHGHHYPLCWIALYSAHKKKIPTVLSLHGTYALNPTRLGGRSIAEDTFNNYMFRNLLRISDYVVGSTKQNIEYARKFSPIDDKFRIIPNGIDSVRFIANIDRKNEYREKLGVDQKKIVILFVGRFDESKGAINFAKAAEMLLLNHESKFEIIMVGQGKEEQEIISIAKQVNGMHIYGWQPAEKIHEFYIASDIFVLPSKFEGLPLTILEAMAANLYIIYSDVGGVNEILSSYSKKKMLKSITPEEISNTCVTLFEEGIDETNNNSNRYVFDLDWQNIGKKFDELYNEISRSKFVV